MANEPPAPPKRAPKAPKPKPAPTAGRHTCLNNVRRKDRLYKVGEEIELTAEEAVRLVKLGAVEPAE